jgi:Uma2 family endonuclease
MVATEAPRHTHGADRDLLWETWEELDLPPGSRAEILRGAIYLSPTPMSKHNRLYAKLSRQLSEVTARLGSEIVNTETVLLPATDEAAVPDMVVVPDEVLDEHDDWRLPPDDVQLVAEITSDSTRKRDLTIKLESYAKANIPIYLVIDQFDGEGTVTVYHQPDGTGRYLQHQTVPFGEPIRLPKPFDIELDTMEFQSRRRKA